jgi:hypothetical protein
MEIQEGTTVHFVQRRCLRNRQCAAPGSGPLLPARFVMPICAIAISHPQAHRTLYGVVGRRLQAPRLLQHLFYFRDDAMETP